MAARTLDTRPAPAGTAPRRRFRELVTPLLDVTPEGASGYRILAKLEALNPGLSVKDRVARHLVAGALASWTGDTAPVLVEASSGNTAVSVAMAAQEQGLHSVLFVPEGTSPARLARMRAFGAQVILTPDAAGTGGAREMALEAVAGRPSHFFLDQHGSDLNVEAHLLSTGPEVISQLGGLSPARLVLSVGTGGTLIGLGESLGRRYPEIVVTGVVPAEGSAIPGMRRLDAASVPLHARLSGVPVEEVDPDVADWWRAAVRRESGVPVGPSSGAAMASAVNAGESGGGVVVTLFPDHGFNYG